MQLGTVSIWTVSYGHFVKGPSTASGAEGCPLTSNPSRLGVAMEWRESPRGHVWAQQVCTLRARGGHMYVSGAP